MSLSKVKKDELNALCKKFRIDLIELLHSIQTGHPGGSLSVCEILTTLYFEKAKVDPRNPQWAERDRIVLTKGHAAPMLYRVLAEKGFFPVEEMKTLRQLNTRLQGHPCALDTPGVELSTGPLGIGLAASVGMAVGLRLSDIDSTVYAVLGDGELDEGTVWEACMSAAKFKTDNLVAILDHNHVQLDGTSDEIMPMGDVGAKFASFGFEVIPCDGHDVEALCDAIDKAKAVKGKPSIIIAETVKGKGVSFMEGKNTWHGKAINDEEYKLAMEELRGDK
ncbi:transketolase [Caproiciproducens sp.]|uniref:transketolase n=1 Tax=Caproiciproducens sp. TaxID=1954376 RepID=UPI00289BFA24|nr:transketolase [Caproiciproducens sp.]